MVRNTIYSIDIRICVWNRNHFLFTESTRASYMQFLLDYRQSQNLPQLCQNPLEICKRETPAYFDDDEAGNSLCLNVVPQTDQIGRAHFHRGEVFRGVIGVVEVDLTLLGNLKKSSIRITTPMFKS